MKNSGDNVFAGIPVGAKRGILVWRLPRRPRFVRPTLGGHSPTTSGSLPDGSLPQMANGSRSGRVTDQGHRRFQEPSAAGPWPGRGDRQPQPGHDSSIFRLAGRTWPRRRQPRQAGQGIEEDVALAPKGLDRTQVRKLLREIELRNDIRAAAIFSLMLYTGCRVGDLVALDLHDLMIAERSGSVTFRHGKGNKQRSCPLPLPARKALAAYLETRPPVESSRVFVGERGPLTDRGVRALCDKYSCDLRLQAAPALASPHDGPPVLGGQSRRSGRPGPTSRP